LFLITMFFLKFYERRRILLLLVIVLFTVVIDLGEAIMVGSSNGIERDLSVVSKQQAGLAQFAARWDNLKDTIYHYYGGPFSNFFILVPAVYWLFRSKLRETSTIFLLAFLSLAILPLFFGSVEIQARIFYDIP